MNIFIQLYDMAVKYKDMAIRQKEILRKLKEEDFNEEELSLLKDIEDYIDKIITDTYNGGEIWIDLSIAKFFYHPIKKKMCNYLPDFIIKYKDVDGNIHTEIIEIKSYSS